MARVLGRFGVPDEMARVINDALDRGWRGSLTANGHFRLLHPIANRTVICSASTDPHAVLNSKRILSNFEKKYGPPMIKTDKIIDNKSFEILKTLTEKVVDTPVQIPEVVVKDTSVIKKETMKPHKPLSEREQSYQDAFVLRADGASTTAIGKILNRSDAWSAIAINRVFMASEIWPEGFNDNDIIAVHGFKQITNNSLKPKLSKDALDFIKKRVPEIKKGISPNKMEALVRFSIIDSTVNQDTKVLIFYFDSSESNFLAAGRDFQNLRLSIHGDLLTGIKIGFDARGTYALQRRSIKNGGVVVSSQVHNAGKYGFARTKVSQIGVSMKKIGGCLSFDYTDVPKEVLDPSLRKSYETTRISNISEEKIADAIIATAPKVVAPVTPKVVESMGPIIPEVAIATPTNLSRDFIIQTLSAAKLNVEAANKNLVDSINAARQAGVDVTVSYDNNGRPSIDIVTRMSI